MTQPSRIFSLALFAATSLLLPGRATAQSGTVTDDAFVSSNVATQLFNLKGQGISLIVAGSTATVGSTQVGTTTTYIKFQLTSSLPPNVAATNVQKATLKLFLSPLTVPTGAIDIYPVTGSWTESTLSTSSAPTLAATPIASDVTLGMANTFLVVDVTQLVQDWLNGTANGGFANDGIALVAHTGSSYAVFDSKESVVTSHEPRLEIALANTGAQGPQGSQGPAGATGATGATGGTGAPGSAATLQVGTTMTVPAGTPASALNGGTPNAAVLNFLIPQGPIGMTGPQGPVGINNRNMWGMGNSYNPNDAVSYNNSFWLATAVDNGAQPPSGNPNWQLLAAGINNRGAWSASNSYNVNDAVTDAGSYWLALAPTSGTSTPSTSCEPSLQLPCSTDWQQLAAQGAIGAQGANGATGPAGQSVASSLEPSGPNCAFGGSKFSAANGTTYACNGATGATGPQGLAGPSGSGAGGSGFAGLQEFTQTDTFTVPTGVTGILVELWGAGSGGQGGSVGGEYCDAFGGCAPIVGQFGTPGVGGNYARAVIQVTPGATYTVSIGAGGAGGAFGFFNGSTDVSPAPGLSGGATSVTDSMGNVLVSATGGGNPAGSSGPNMIVRSGSAGGFTYNANGILTGSFGGLPAAGSLTVPGQTGQGGQGGCGGNGDTGAGCAGGTGNPGYALIVW